MKKTTNLFEQRFRSLFKSIPDIKFDADEDENTIGGGAFGPAAETGHNGINNTDWYATGDARVPMYLGTQSRLGKVSKTKKRKNKKSRKKTKKK